MGDYVDRSVLRNVLYESETLTLEGLGILNRFPAADVVEVVRCINCKHLDNQYYHGTGWCNYHDITIELDGFCNCGAKMDGKEVEGE